MSAIIARMVFGVTIAVVAAVVYVYSNRRSENTPHSGRNQGSSDYQPRNRWEEEDYGDDNKSLNRATKRSRTTHVDDDCMEDSSSTSATSTGIVKKCGICLELFANLKAAGTEIHSTTCGHIFCIKCLNKSFRVNKLCPQCRKTIDPKQTIRLYM